MPAPALAASVSGNSREQSSVPVNLDAKEAVDIAQGLDENVFLFVPNLIGYTRIILAAVALYYMPYGPGYCTMLYGVSCLLDAIDGHVARMLGQTSRFGAVLDMITDRCTTSALLCFLASAYPTYALLFQALIALDFSSHYLHMYSTLITGSKSHKSVESDVSRILNYYYNNPTVLFLICAGNELFFFALYLAHWESKPLQLPIFPTPILSFLSLLSPHLTHMLTSSRLATFIASLTFAQVLCIPTSLVCFVKNVINVVQMWKASKILVGVDLAERGRLRTREMEKRRLGQS